MLFPPCLDSGLVGQVSSIRKKEALGELPSQGYYLGRGGWGGAPVVDSVRLELVVVPSVENSVDYYLALGCGGIARQKAANRNWGS